MADSTLDQFTTFWESTGPAYKTGLKEMVNEAVKNTYTFPRLQRAHAVEDMIQGGSQIKDRIFLSLVSTAERINPDAELSYINPQTGTDWTAPWSILVAHTSWNKWELGLNGGQLSEGAKVHLFKTVRRQKFQNLYTDIHNKIDSELWAPPDESTMESTTSNALAPFSIPTFVTEDTGGVPLDEEDGAAWDGGAVQGITVSGTTWDNQRASYTLDEDSTIANEANGEQVFEAMSRVMHLCRFDRLPKNPEYSDKETSPHFIACSLNGITIYEGLLRLNQDEFRVGRQDPDYNKPMFRGVPLDYISELDTATLYDSGSSTLVDEENANVIGPRYYFLNGEYLRCVFHEDSYFEMEPVITPEKKPFNRVQIVDVTNNLVCRSRQRQGIVYPGATTDWGSAF